MFSRAATVEGGRGEKWGGGVGGEVRGREGGGEEGGGDGHGGMWARLDGKLHEHAAQDSANPAKRRPGRGAAAQK